MAANHAFQVDAVDVSPERQGAGRRRPLARAAIFAVVLVLAGAAVAEAHLSLEPVGTFSYPVQIAAPPGDPRVFVVEKAGRVLIPGRGTFLDVSALTESVDERGLLSIAFPGDYAATGRFYVFMTTRGIPYSLRVVEYRRSANPDRANPASARVLLSIPHPAATQMHNGGQLQFGPDGMLYVGTGDGGGTGDPLRNAQDLGSELGKILRIDPRTGRAAPGNPFGTRVWVYGLRNPWRFSFDRVTGALWIGDVGQGAWEEVDALTAAGARGANLGWPCWEGRHRYYRSCSAPAAVAPVIEHPHAGFCAVTGGYVVRDPGLPTLAGRYLYGDLCHPALRSATLEGADDRAEPVPIGEVVSFGEDACGRIYVASLGGGVFRLQDGVATPCAYAFPAPDTTAPRLRVAVRGLRRAAQRRRLRVKLAGDEPCVLRVRTRLRGVRTLPARRLTRRGVRPVAVTVRMSAGTARRLRLALRRQGSVRVLVSVTAVDAAGNERRVTRRPRIFR